MTGIDISTKKCTKCKSVLPLSSFNKNKSKPDGLGTECRLCANAHSKKYHSEHIAEHKARGSAYRAANLQKILAADRDYDKHRRDKAAKKITARKTYYKHRTKYLAHGRVMWYKKHEYNLKRKQEYRRSFPELALFHKRTRQTRVVNAFPRWANREAIKVIYAESARLTKETGIKHHVDHYFPLKSDVVCGLHNEFNLRIIPAVENLSKGNSFPEDHI